MFSKDDGSPLSRSLCFESRVCLHSWFIRPSSHAEPPKLTNVTRYKRVCSILEHFLRRLVAALSTHLDGWTSKTGGASPTTEAVHLSMMDCVNTSGFLLAVEGLLALRARPPGFITDGGADCREGDPAMRDIEAKGSDRLSKSASALRHRVSVCASKGSAWDNENGKPRV
jgi:hypothetical protein